MLVGLLPRAPKPVTGWLCWHSAANPSLPANMVNTGRIHQRARKAPNCARRTSQHLNDLDGFLPALTSRENLVRNRDAGDISFRKSGMSALPLKADILSVEVDVRKVPKADMNGDKPQPFGVYQIGECRLAPRFLPDRQFLSEPTSQLLVGRLSASISAPVFGSSLRSGNSCI